jgi:hypothetical protein
MKKLASYWKVSLSAAYKWGDETVHKKTIIMQSGAEPQIIKLIGEISQLCYIFDCQNVVGDEQVKWSLFRATADAAILSIWNGSEKELMMHVNLNQSTAVAELQKVKSTLESFVYGGA